MVPGQWFHFQLSTCKATQPVTIKITFLKQDVSRKKSSLQGKLNLASNLQQIFFLSVPCAGKNRESSIVIGGYAPHDAHGHCRSSLKPGQAPSCSMICSKCNPKGCHSALSSCFPRENGTNPSTRTASSSCLTQTAEKYQGERRLSPFAHY